MGRALLFRGQNAFDLNCRLKLRVFKIRPVIFRHTMSHYGAVCSQTNLQPTTEMSLRCELHADVIVQKHSKCS